MSTSEILSREKVKTVDHLMTTLETDAPHTLWVAKRPDTDVYYVLAALARSCTGRSNGGSPEWLVERENCGIVVSTAGHAAAISSGTTAQSLISLDFRNCDSQRPRQGHRRGLIPLLFLRL
jgi:hypothetical protein